MKKTDIIVNNLTLDFSSGKYEPGQQIPTEKELCTEFKVSRITVRNALEILLKKELINRTAGKGTFFTGKNLGVRRRNNEIALIVPNPVSELMNIADGINEYIKEKDFILTTYFSFESAQFERELCEKAVKEGFSGIILFPANFDEENANYFNQLVNENYPIIFIDRSPIDNCNLVQSNNESGMYKMTQYLIECGHKDIAYITALNVKTLKERLYGYKQCLLKNHISLNDQNIKILNNTLATVSDNPNEVYNAIDEILAQENLPTAIMCSNDIVALHVINRLNQVNQGNKISVTGFDNANFSSKNAYSITTVEQDFKSIGNIAMKMLDNIINLKEESLTVLKIPTKIIKRSSTFSINLD